MEKNTLRKLTTNYLLVLLLGWTIVMLGLLSYNYFSLHQTTKNLAYQEANSFFNRDKVFRVWATEHGGFYVPETEKTPANPYLAHIPERNITTTSGKKLTLMNPAYALRQINHDFTEAVGISGHITSLLPLRPENAPDTWEAKALSAFENGDTVVSEFGEFNNVESLRLMRPLSVSEGCLKCHAHQGYQVGDIRGGISVAVPLAPYLIQEKKAWASYWISYSSLWALGLIIFILGFKTIRKYLVKAEEAKIKLKDSKRLLEIRVDERTKDLNDKNVELINSKEQAEDSEERYRGLISTMMNAFALHEMIYDSKGRPIDYRFLEVNPAWENTVGIKKEMVLGKTVKEIIPDIEQRWIELYGKVVSTGIPEDFIDFNKATNKHLHVFAYTPESGKFAVFFNDVTEMKLSEDKLKKALKKTTESDRVKSAFLATMSHELRTPLNSIIGFSDLIKEQSDVSEIKEFNETVNASGNHLLNIVEDLFDISLIETGQIKTRKEEFELHSFLAEIRNVILIDQVYLKKENLAIRLLNVPIIDKKQVLFTDLPKLKQILINLLKNALKFTEEGSISFGYNQIEEEDQKMLAFFISDTGIGIEQKKFDLIFDNFKQVDDSYTRTFGGVGIGLSISKKLVELLGGRIWLESEVGVGSTFYFTIPVNGDEEDKKKLQVSEIDIEAIKDITVLVVEDDENSFEFLKILLTKADIKNYWAKDGEEAIKYCKEKTDIDMILMDINMPVMDGYEATKQIKKLNPNLPIIAQTAYAIAGDYEKALEAGCDDYISKPIKKKLLMEKIEKHVKS